MITLARVQSEAAKAVAEMGRDFRYNENGGNCVYRPMNVGEVKDYFGGKVQPGDPKTLTPCIIGRMLESMHVMTQYIRECSTSVAGLFGSDKDFPTYYGGIFEDAAVVYMSHLQYFQDHSDGHSWGYCYDSTETKVARGEIG